MEIGMGLKLDGLPSGFLSVQQVPLSLSLSLSLSHSLSLALSDMTIFLRAPSGIIIVNHNNNTKKYYRLS
jgi:hypothetical protein